MDGGVQAKQDALKKHSTPETNRSSTVLPSRPISVIHLSSSSSESDDSDDPSSDDNDGVFRPNGKSSRVSIGGFSTRKKKKKKKMKKMEQLGVDFPPGFINPLPPQPNAASLPSFSFPKYQSVENCKHFWRAGDYVGETGGGDWDTSSGGMDHVRVHPKFLHSNATSHKWVLGAFAELLDNSLDEVCNGATFVKIDMLKNKKDGSRMLLIEDNGGGMDPDKMRQCVSLGYSVKGKLVDTIGQYGNGFKTSTMRLGADVVVFSRCYGQHGNRSTQSIALLSYTFLRSTKKEDILVPMLDYEGGELEWKRMVRSSASDWNRNVETIMQWSPFSNEADLLQQFNQMKDHGTRIIIYNLWEDDQGQLELDFDADPFDIQIRGVNRDEKKIQMAKQFRNSKHFLTYRHSLRSYASILYLRIPPGFRIILRGKDVEHHNVVNDMMMRQEITYRPQPAFDGVPKDYDMVAVVIIGFVKDAKAHIDVQGFNVYHKNRLIKPFWRIWNPSNSHGRGVIGVLEANFVEPAHNKQGFERTIVLSRLETKLIQMQKTYWSMHCHKIGYVTNSNKHIDHKETSPGYLCRTSSQSEKKNTGSCSKIAFSFPDKLHSHLNQEMGRTETESYLKTVDKSQLNGHMYTKGENGTKTPEKSGKVQNPELSPPSEKDVSDNEMQTDPLGRQANCSYQKEFPANKPQGNHGSHIRGSSPNLENKDAEEHCASDGRPVRIATPSQSKGDVCGTEFSPSNSDSYALDQLKEENRQLRERLCRKEEKILSDMLNNLQIERDRCKSLEIKLMEANQRIDELQKEQESLVVIFSEERDRRDTEEQNLRKKLKDATTTNQVLLDKITLLERMK